MRFLGWILEREYRPACGTSHDGEVCALYEFANAPRSVLAEVLIDLQSEVNRATRTIADLEALVMAGDDT